MPQQQGERIDVRQVPGTFVSVTGSLARIDAAIIGSAAFFEPLAVTIPLSGVPPLISKDVHVVEIYSRMWWIVEFRRLLRFSLFCLDDARQAGEVFDCRVQLQGRFVLCELADRRFDHRADLHEQPAAGRKSLGSRGDEPFDRFPFRVARLRALRGSKFFTVVGSLANSAELT